MKAIFLQVLKARRWSIFWWSLGITLFVALNILIYPSFRDQAAELNRTISHLPDTVRALFGAASSISSPAGYLNARQYYMLLPILFIILAVGLGSSVLAREEQDHTLELLLSRPISRGRLLLAKGFGALCVLLSISVIVTLATVGLAAAIHLELATSNILLAHLMLWLLATLFGALAFLLTAWGKSARLLSVGLASLIALLTYTLTSLKELADWLKLIAKLLPYDYYRPEAILNGTFSSATAGVYTLIVIVFAVLAWIGFRRRDIE